MAFAAATTSFVGRGSEVDEVGHLLAETRLLTIMGAGGSGKTRLALEVARRLHDRYPAGRHVCELAALPDAASVRATVGVALGLGSDPGERLTALAAQQFGDQPALLVVDNCEHLREAVAVVVTDLLGGTTSLVVLATSRERLRIPGEIAWMIPPLSLPGGDGELEGSEAVELLVERARSLDPGFTVTQGNREAVVEICRRLEGMPLAIELAASRLALLPPAQVARMLDDALSVLTGADGPARQRTLRAALDWSYELLAEEDRETLRLLSVFAAPCTLAAAAVVLDDPEAATLDRLAALRDRSLLVAETGGQLARFRLLEPIRQYAFDQLRRHGEEDEARRRHAIWVLTAVEELSPQFFGGAQQRVVAAFRELLADLQGAFGWALFHEPQWAARTASATAWAWDLVGHLTEGDTLLRASLDAHPNDQELTRILGGLSVLAGRRGDERRLNYAARAVAAARAGGDTPELGYALFALATALVDRGRRTEAEAAFDETHDLAQQTGDRLLLTLVDGARTLPLIASGDVALARRAWEASITVAGESGDVHGQGIALGTLAYICLEMRDHTAARRALQQALTLLEQHRNWAMSAQLLGFAARLASRRGRFREAFRLFGAYRRLLALVDRPIEPIGEDEQLARLQLSAAEVETALAEGAALTVREMFALARLEAERSDAVERGWLSDRELEVARLVARGLSNKEIASRLRRSERTVENHVQHVLAKLDFHSRAQVGAWAQEHGLLD